MVQPVLVQRVQLLLFFLGGQALPHGFQLAEHAVVAHAAQRGDAAEADGQKVQPAQEQIARLHPAQQRGIQHPQAAHFPLFLAQICAGAVGVGVPLHERELLAGRHLRRQLFADFHILNAVHIEFCHVGPLLLSKDAYFFWCLLFSALRQLF